MAENNLYFTICNVNIRSFYRSVSHLPEIWISKSVLFKYILWCYSDSSGAFTAMQWERRKLGDVVHADLGQQKNALLSAAISHNTWWCILFRGKTSVWNALKRNHVS